MGRTVVRGRRRAIAARAIRCYEFDMHRTHDAPLEFVASLRFEVFYALASLFDPAARVHAAWRARARRDLPRSFWAEARVFGPARELWIALAAALPHDEPLSEWEPLWSALERADARELAATTLKGLLHARDAVDEMLRARDVRPAMRRVARAERDWLRTLGLFPFRRTAPLAVAIDALVRDPPRAVDRMRSIVRRFWDRAFARTFLDARPRYASAVRALEEYGRATSLAAFADSLLRVRVDGDTLAAVEGGYRVRLREVRKIVVMPSAFNERRYWSAVDAAGGTIVYLPTFEPALEIAAPRADRPVLPVLRALADASRWRMIVTLLRGPRTASELARSCGIGKATVSHHVRVLTEARLVTRAPRRGSVLLSANREAIRALGDRIVGAARP